MLITRETDYAIRTIRALSALKLLTVKQICDQESIPIQFAYKILKKLSKAGIVEIIRGASGGYLLAADLDKLTLYDVIMVTGENVDINECLAPGYNCINNSGEKECCIHSELMRIQKILDEELKRYPFKKIMTAHLADA